MFLAQYRHNSEKQSPKPNNTIRGYQWERKLHLSCSYRDRGQETEHHSHGSPAADPRAKICQALEHIWKKTIHFSRQREIPGSIRFSQSNIGLALLIGKWIPGSTQVQLDISNTPCRMQLNEQDQKQVATSARTFATPGRCKSTKCWNSVRGLRRGNWKRWPLFSSC